MKKFLLAFLALAFISAPMLMWSMPDGGHQSDKPAACINDCLEEPALGKARLADLHDLNALPVPPSPALLSIVLGIAAVLLYAPAQMVFRYDRQSLFCSYLE